MAKSTQKPKTTKKAAKKGGLSKSSSGFTDEEKQAMKEYLQEKKAAASGGRVKVKAEGESDVIAKIAAMPEPDRSLCERLHSIIKASAPDLGSRLWYGMPAYYKDGKHICFFQSAEKFKTRYLSLGFMHASNLDDGQMWPTAFAVTGITTAEEARIAELVKKAVS